MTDHGARVGVTVFGRLPDRTTGMARHGRPGFVPGGGGPFTPELR